MPNLNNAAGMSLISKTRGGHRSICTTIINKMCNLDQQPLTEITINEVQNMNNELQRQQTMLSTLDEKMLLMIGEDDLQGDICQLAEFNMKIVSTLRLMSIYENRYSASTTSTSGAAAVQESIFAQAKQVKMTTIVLPEFS